jgi:hypothetical protein
VFPLENTFVTNARVLYRVTQLAAGIVFDIDLAVRRNVWVVIEDHGKIKHKISNTPARSCVYAGCATVNDNTSPAARVIANKMLDKKCKIFVDLIYLTSDISFH